MPNSLYPQVNLLPPRPSKIVEPNVFAMPKGCERYTVVGGGAIFVIIAVGDKITIINDEGGQPCEIMVADGQGRADAGILDAKANSDLRGFKTLLSEGDSSLQSVRSVLQKHKIDLAKSAGLSIFSSTTLAKTEHTFITMRDGVVAIAAPCGENGRMDFQLQDTATPLSVIIQRAQANETQRFKLPDPLADPLADFRVQSATAEAYLVKAGDYIQILDVDGRQCTDFQCFDARKLDKGIEHPLDVTTTRTLMGHSYPMPGLHAKYYDQDMLPLVEVVQDTCGRHDAFALACAAKYYDDLGYPGHANCSDNFNGALAKFNVSPRAGWMAINFFFNTNIDEHGVLYTDEPWSRPGDYVLVKALTDVVCVTSACPDDTTAANGWNPSDIHVRTYDANHFFSRAVAIRTTPNSELKMTKNTGFHDKFAQYTRNFIEYNGYWLANDFARGGAIEEYWAARKKSVIMDLSPLRKCEITGPDSEALCQYVFTRNMKTLPVSGVVYTAMCYEHGGMIDDGTVFRLGKDNFRWIGGSDFGIEWLRDTAKELDLKVLVRSSTDQLHNVAVQGPESRDVLRKIIWTQPDRPELDQLEWFRFTPARLFRADGVPVVVSRTGYTGELGYEVMCHPKHCDAVFDAIWDAGQDHGLQPLGLEALDMLRIESGLIFAGYDFSDKTDPFEAGVGFTVPLKSKPDTFIGRDALIRRKDYPMRKFVGLDIDSNVAVEHGDCLHVGRAQVGEVTSSVRSPLLGKNIALARVDVAHAAEGTEIEVGKLDGQQKRLPAKIVGLSHYDPKKSKPRS